MTTQQTNNKTNLKSLLILGLAATFLVSTSAYAFGLLNSQNTMNSTGIIANANIGVYSNPACTINQTSINWGTAYPGDNKTTTVYIKNLGTVDITLAVATSSWNPAAAQTYLTLTSDYTGQTLTPGQSRAVTFTLKVKSNITGISTYTFNIVITSTG